MLSMMTAIGRIVFVLLSSYFFINSFFYSHHIFFTIPLFRASFAPRYMRLPFTSTPIKFCCGNIFDKPTVYSPRPQASSRMSGWSFLKKFFHWPFMPSGYSNTFGNSLMAAKRNNFFCPMAGKGNQWPFYLKAY